jgi:hypothetical protein
MTKILIAVVLIVLAASGALVLRRSRVPIRKFPMNADRELDGFRSGRPPGPADYEELFRYFLEGFETYRSPHGALIYYHGLPSRHGTRVDALEGFSRSAPMWGAWVHSGRPRVIRMLNGDNVDLVDQFRKGLLSGTDARGDEYWGDVSDLDQRIVEASDIALSVWLFRDTVWDTLSTVQKAQVVNWLKQSEVHEVSDNNWHLFPVFIGAVLTSLGTPNGGISMREHYARFKEFYRGDGWFSDGPGNNFDYYNAWAIHYQLYWLQQVDPGWDREFILGARHQFLANYRYLMGPHGVPILGRSVCYRMAAPAPLVFGQEADGSEISRAEARRALDLTWSYFIRRGALKDGNVSQGYCGADPRILDNYSGPASCLWALRSLIAAYYMPSKSAFWKEEAGSLPIDEAGYKLEIPAIHWTVTGEKSTGTIRINRAGGTDVAIQLSTYGAVRQLASAFLWRPFRPENSRAKYDQNLYSSAQPFCGCLGPN